MYNSGTPGQGAIAPIAGLGAIAALPATGADLVTTLAAAVVTTLVVWGAVYIFKITR